HVTALTNDYYHFDSASQTLTGERSGLSFRLGDRVQVVVSKVDLDDRKIDLQLVGTPDSKGPGRALPQRNRPSGKRDRREERKGRGKDRKSATNKSAGRRQRRGR